MSKLDERALEISPNMVFHIFFWILLQEAFEDVDCAWGLQIEIHFFSYSFDWFVTLYSRMFHSYRGSLHREGRKKQGRVLGENPTTLLRLLPTFSHITRVSGRQHIKTGTELCDCTGSCVITPNWHPYMYVLRHGALTPSPSPLSLSTPKIILSVITGSIALRIC